MALKAPKNTTYKSAYSSKINDLVSQAINRKPFEYDPATDAAYQSYARQYTRLGDQAAQNTMADVAAQTGGMPSSYAVTAANQQRSDFNQQLTDKIPSLMEAAYAKYRDDQNSILANLNVMQNLEDSAYSRFTSDRDYARTSYESDRAFQEQQRQYNKEFKRDQKAAEYERMLNLWNTLGKANKKVAKYFGVKVGTKTSDAAYRAAELALQRARLK